jgi:hypothetical protein
MSIKNGRRPVCALWIRRVLTLFLMQTPKQFLRSCPILTLPSSCWTRIRQAPFREQHKLFVHRVESTGRATVRLTIAPFQRQPRFRALAFDAMQELAREMVEQWLRSVELEAITLFRAAVARFVDAASDPASCSTTAFGRLVAALTRDSSTD